MPKTPEEFVEEVARTTKWGEMPQQVPGATLNGGYVLLEDEPQQFVEMLGAYIGEARLIQAHRPLVSIPEMITTLQRRCREKGWRWRLRSAYEGYEIVAEVYAIEDVSERRRLFRAQEKDMDTLLRALLSQM